MTKIHAFIYAVYTNIFAYTYSIFQAPGILSKHLEFPAIPGPDSGLRENSEVLRLQIHLHRPSGLQPESGSDPICPVGCRQVISCCGKNVDCNGSSWTLEVMGIFFWGFWGSARKITLLAAPKTEVTTDWGEPNLNRQFEWGKWWSS